VETTIQDWDEFLKNSEDPKGWTPKENGNFLAVV
jgi:hypothetical protein